MKDKMLFHKKEIDNIPVPTDKLDAIIQQTIEEQDIRRVSWIRRGSFYAIASIAILVMSIGIAKLLPIGGDSLSSPGESNIPPEIIEKNILITPKEHNNPTEIVEIEAMMVGYDTVNELIAESDLIAFVRVEEKVRFYKKSAMPTTEMIFTVTKPLFNGEVGQEINVHLMGGEDVREKIDLVEYVVHGSSIPKVGEEYLVFLKQFVENNDEQNNFFILGETQGRFLLKDDTLFSVNNSNRIYTKSDVISFAGINALEVEQEITDKVSNGSWKNDPIIDGKLAIIQARGLGLDDFVLYSDLIAFVKAGELINEDGVETNIAFTVTKPLFGAQTEGETVVLNFEPGDEPLPVRGEEYLAFLSLKETGIYWTVGGPVGRFKIDDGQLFELNNVHDMDIDFSLNGQVANEVESDLLERITRLR